MKERLDCALLCVPGCESAIDSLLASQPPHTSRLHLARVELPVPEFAQGDRYPPPDCLRALPYPLRRFDAIILPVSPTSLVWTRILLQQTRMELHRPMLALGLSLKPIGILDLLQLGVSDFVFWPCDPEEIRVRLLRVLRISPRQAYHDQPQVSLTTAPPSVAEPGLSPLSASARLVAAAGAMGYGASLAGTTQSRPLAVARSADHCLPSGLASRMSSHFPPDVPAYGDSLPGANRLLQHQALQAPWVCCQQIASHPGGFQQLKSRVVAQFERAYLSHALARSNGNIAMAARNSSKHRRAFWALMRKHRINADDFRDHAI